MERRWTRSQDDVGGPMEKNGDALRKHTRTPNTVSATCTVAATVQESLWNHKQCHHHHHHPLLSLLPPLHLQTSTTFPQQMPLLLKIIISIPFPMGFQVNNTGKNKSFLYTFHFALPIGKYAILLCIAWICFYLLLFFTFNTFI